MKNQIILCSINEIKNISSKGFFIEIENIKLNLMAIHTDKGIFVYVNSCPHIGSPLDFTPGEFLDQKKQYILCSTHGALFRIDDGHCISGPCQGKYLKKIETTVNDNNVIIELNL